MNPRQPSFEFLTGIAPGGIITTRRDVAGDPGETNIAVEGHVEQTEPSIRSMPLFDTPLATELDELLSDL